MSSPWLASILAFYSRGGLPRWLSGKASTCSSGEIDSIPGLGRSLGERNANPLQYPFFFSLQYSCLGNPIERVPCQVINSPWCLERIRHHLAPKQKQPRALGYKHGFELHFFFLYIYPEVELLGHMAVLYFFRGTSIAIGF